MRVAAPARALHIAAGARRFYTSEVAAAVAAAAAAAAATPVWSLQSIFPRCCAERHCQW